MVRQSDHRLGTDPNLTFYEKVDDDTSLRNALLKINNMLKKSMILGKYRSVALWIIPQRAFLASDYTSRESTSELHESVISFCGDLYWDTASLVSLSVGDAKQAMRLVHDAFPNVRYAVDFVYSHGEGISTCPFDGKTLSSGKVLTLRSVTFDVDDAKALLPTTKLEMQCEFLKSAGKAYVSRAAEVGYPSDISTSRFLDVEDLVTFLAVAHPATRKKNPNFRNMLPKKFPKKLLVNSRIVGRDLGRMIAETEIKEVVVHWNWLDDDALESLLAHCTERKMPLVLNTPVHRDKPERYLKVLQSKAPVKVTVTLCIQNGIEWGWHLLKGEGNKHYKFPLQIVVYHFPGNLDFLAFINVSVSLESKNVATYEDDAQKNEVLDSVCNTHSILELCQQRSIRHATKEKPNESTTTWDCSVYTGSIEDKKWLGTLVVKVGVSSPSRLFQLIRNHAFYIENDG